MGECNDQAPSRCHPPLEILQFGQDRMEFPLHRIAFGQGRMKFPLHQIAFGQDRMKVSLQELQNGEDRVEGLRGGLGKADRTSGEMPWKRGRGSSRRSVVPPVPVANARPGFDSPKATALFGFPAWFPKSGVAAQIGPLLYFRGLAGPFFARLRSCEGRLPSRLSGFALRPGEGWQRGSARCFPGLVVVRGPAGDNCACNDRCMGSVGD